jgi:hypothetical protein
LVTRKTTDDAVCVGVGNACCERVQYHFADLVELTRTVDIPDEIDARPSDSWVPVVERSPTRATIGNIAQRHHSVTDEV